MSETMIDHQPWISPSGRARRSINHFGCLVIALIVTSAGAGALAQRTFIHTKNAPGIVNLVPAHPNPRLGNYPVHPDQRSVSCASTQPTKVVTVEYRFPSRQCATLLALDTRASI